MEFFRFQPADESSNGHGREQDSKNEFELEGINLDVSSSFDHRAPRCPLGARLATLAAQLTARQAH